MGSETTSAPPSPSVAKDPSQVILDNVPAMIAVHDGSGNLVLLNRGFTELLGWTLEEARKVDLTAECYPDPSTRREVIAHMAATPPGWKDFRIRARDGRVIESSWSNAHLPDGTLIATGIDISARKRAEEELAAKQSDMVLRDLSEQGDAREKLAKAMEDFERFFRLVPDLLCIASVDGYFKKLNNAWETALGHTVEELLGSPYRAFVHPEDVDLTIKEAENICAGRFEGGFVNRYRCKDGSYRWLQWSSTSPKEDGLFFAVARDITEMKATAERLRASEERYRSIFEESRAAMLLIDPDTGSLMDANPAACEFYGHARDGLKTMKILDLNVLSPGEVFAEMELAKAEKRNHFFFTHRLASGEVRPVEVFSGPVAVDGKKLLFSIVHDVTERKTAERALRESEERFRSLADLMPQAVYEVDAASRLTYMNRHGLKLFGYTEEELLDRVTVIDLFDPTDRDRGRENLRKRFEEGDSLPEQYTCRRKDGVKIPVLLTSAPFRRDGRLAGAGGVIVDLTGLRKAEAELSNSRKYEAVGRLAGGVAHHLNNLMTVVAGYGTLIVGRMDIRDPWRREVEEMRLAGERAAVLTSKLLSYSRRQMIRPQKMELGPFLSGMEADIRSVAGPKTVVSLLHDPGTGVVHVDPALLRDAILCMVENSRDAMPEGGTLTVFSRSADVSGEGGPPVPAGKYAMISVNDTGVGMDDETRSHVFEPFFTTRKVGEGSGLSLPSVYGFVKQSGGYIFVESEPGKGTNVLIYFPVGLR